MITTPGPLITSFAPAERFAPAQIELQVRRFLDVSPLLRDMLDAVPEVVLVLNAARQVIFANRAGVGLLGASEAGPLGLRPGEALDCSHAFDGLGCGTTDFCRTCGAVRAILTSQAGREDTQECRITRRADGEALDLRVHATPIDVAGDKYTIFVMTDISHEKRRRALEHVFFHDILNTATAMRASADIMQRAAAEDLDDMTGRMRRLVDRLIEEVLAQRQLLEAENDELAVDPAPLDAANLIAEMAQLYARHEMSRGREIRLDLPAAELLFTSDPVLLRRVLGNMVKNALEASRPGDTVTLGCASCDDGVEFWVNNPAVMPPAVQMQVFQRSFSTKGGGRGLGTYSMKLLSERYLHGRVTFTSLPGHGTTFRAWFPLQLSRL